MPRVKGQRDTKPRKPYKKRAEKPNMLTPFLHLIGVEADVDVAAKAGCSREYVRQIRARLGRPIGFDKRRVPRCMFPAKTLRIINQWIGRVPDCEVARRAGCSQGAIGKYRRAAGVSRAVHTSAIRWTPALIALMGKVSDKELARRAGCHLMTAYKKRRALGIAMQYDGRRKPAKQRRAA